MTRAAAPRPSLQLRLALWSAASITLVSILLSLTYQARMRELLTREADARTRTLGEHLAANAALGVLAGSGEMLASVVATGLDYPDVLALAVYDASGVKLASAGRDDLQVTDLSALPTDCMPCAQVEEHFRWATPVTRRTGGDAFFEGNGPSDAVEIAGHVLMTVSTETRRQEARALLGRGVAVSAGVLLLGLLVAVVIAQRLTAPLRTLAEATRQVGTGDWDVKLPDHAPGELEDLFSDFRGMAADLRRLDEENRRYRENLEEMVAKRTRELEAAYERMKALNRAKDDFVATVSHDFRSPLAIILSMTQTLQADPDMPQETAARFLGRVERQCKRLQSLVNDLLDLARMENREAEFVTLSLGDFVEDQVEMAQPAFADKGVSLASHVDAAVEARVDRVLLERALGNLLDNALKFTPAPGTVAVGVDVVDGEARITVRDSGLGVAEADLPRLFERFFQSDRDSTSGEGSGLGLAIVAEVMRKHGGRVEVDSALGEGTTFTLVLPKGE